MTHVKVPREVLERMLLDLLQKDFFQVETAIRHLLYVSDPGFNGLVAQPRGNASKYLQSLKVGESVAFDLRYYKEATLRCIATRHNKTGKVFPCSVQEYLGARHMVIRRMS